MTVGERIKNARLAAGLTQEELGKKINVNKEAIHKYEKGLVENIPIPKFQMLADALNVDAAWLAGWLETPIQSETTFNATYSMSSIRREAHEAIDSMDEEKLKKLLQVFELVKDM